MMLIGTAQVSGDEYFFCVKGDRTCITYSLISKYNLEVMDGSAVVIQDADALKKWYTPEYLVGSLKKYKTSGRIKKFGNINTIEQVLGAYNAVKMYTFGDGAVSENEKGIEAGMVYNRFSAADSKAIYQYDKENDKLLFLIFSFGGISVKLEEGRFTFNPKVEYENVNTALQKRLSLVTIKTIKYDDLAENLDMSWYKKDGVVLKRYSSVKTKREFEERVMTPVIKYLQECSNRGEVADISLDTETTGLNVYHLSKDNPDKDHVVSIQLSWEDDQGVAIFLDMENFGNVPTEYVVPRLQNLFEDFKGERSVPYFDGGEKKSFSFSRDLINLIGHNMMFDRRVCYDAGGDYYFNEDTLQIAFNLDPKRVKGKNKLKTLTRRVYGHETPELSDVLGKGNDDKYRYLVDEEVANIYGCADVDYTRKLKKFLKSVTDKALYVRYRIQDIPLMNRLAISEYYGLNMLQEPVRKLADEVYNNIEVLKNAMYEYVGVYMDYVQKRQVIELLWDAGYYKEREDYDKAVEQIVVNKKAVYRFEFKASSLRDVLYNVMKYPIFAYTDGKIRLPKVDKYVIKKLLKYNDDGSTTNRKLNKSILRYGANYAEYDKLMSGSKEDKKAAEKMELISAEKFNSKKYPLALIVEKYSELNKEYTSVMK